MSPMQRKLLGILSERYHKMWLEELANGGEETMRNGFFKRSGRTRAREILHRARKRWHIMLRSLGARTSLEQWDPPPPESDEVSVADPSCFELELPNGFVVLPTELATKILVLGGLP